MAKLSLSADGRTVQIVGEPPSAEVLERIKHRIGPDEAAVVVSQEDVQAFFDGLPEETKGAIQRELIAHIAGALDDAVRRGDIDEACRQAKELTAATGVPTEAAGRAAIICLVESVERVVGDLPEELKS